MSEFNYYFILRWIIILCVLFSLWIAVPFPDFFWGLFKLCFSFSFILFPIFISFVYWLFCISLCIFNSFVIYNLSLHSLPNVNIVQLLQPWAFWNLFSSASIRLLLHQSSYAPLKEASRTAPCVPPHFICLFVYFLLFVLPPAFLIEFKTKMVWNKTKSSLEISEIFSITLRVKWNLWLNLQYNYRLKIALVEIFIPNSNTISYK